jgi:hypothetical protein
MRGKEQTMFFGQTSNWRKQVTEVTDNGQISYPAIAAEYQDTVNAIRVHCGAESQVLLKVQIYLTSPEDFDAFDRFLQRFGLPRNGYQVVNTYQPQYQAPLPVYYGADGQSAPLLASHVQR